MVNPTSIPDWIRTEPWFELTHPATRYTSAGVIEKKNPISAKNERPIIVWRICRPVSRSFSSRNRPISKDWRPKDLDSSIPETDSVSSVIDVRSASVFWVLVATTRRAFPTRTVSHRNSGRRSKDRMVSGIEMISIVTIVLTIVTVFDRTVDAVSVTTDVVRQPRLDLTGPRRGEESQRHLLQVAVERVAEVLHHAEPDLIREIRLPDPDDAGHQRDRDHQGDVAVQQGQVRAGLAGTVAVRSEQRLVEHRDDQQGVHHAETGRDDDGEADDRDLLLVRREGSNHPTNGCRLDRPRILVERPSAHAEHASVPSHSLQRYGGAADVTEPARRSTVDVTRRSRRCAKGSGCDGARRRAWPG